MAEVPLSIIKGFILNVLNELLKVSYSTRDVYKEKTRLSQPIESANLLANANCVSTQSAVHN